VTAIRKHLSDFVAVVVLLVVAVGVAAYILPHERLRFPFIQEPQMKLKAEFATAQAVTPGQGQTVRVAGVKIGDLSKVDLKDGRAVVTLAIDPKYKHLIHTDATALLRPKTGLKDMFVEVQPHPGGPSSRAPVAKEGWTMPVANTLPDINPDEIFSALDGDTRDYLRLLINGAGRGLAGRGQDLQEVFARFEPTHRDLARVTSQVAKRRSNLRRLINSLNILNGELASKRQDVSQLVDSSAAVFHAFASEDQNIASAVQLFPGALKTTTNTLGKVQTFANVLRPTADNLRPAARELNVANHAILPFVKEAEPELRKQIRPFVKDARPLVRDLRPAAINLAKATPQLTRSFKVLNDFFNLIGYNPGGAEAPTLQGGTDPRQEGWLYTIAWADHVGANLWATEDAHGGYRPVTLAGTCGTLKGLVAEEPAAEFLLNLTPILTSTGACG